MQLYDEIIKKWLSHFESSQAKSFEIKNDLWPETANAEMVLRGDSAFEIGLEPAYGLGGTAVTTDASLVAKDEILLYGKDIQNCNNTSSYARLCIVRCNDESIKEEKLYNFVSAIEYVRYHVNPKGVMMRISKTNNKEGLRISKTAYHDHFSFEDLGNLFIKEYHKNKSVEAVKVIFVCMENFDYKILKEEIAKSIGITKALDHMMRSLVMDCDVCNLQPICEEVEGLREQHFSTSNK